MQKRFSARAFLRTTLAAASISLLLAGSPLTARAEEYAVKELQVLIGCPGCEASTVVRWDQNGVECVTPVPKQSDIRVTIDLADRPFTFKNPWTGCILTAGTEVWARVDLPKSGASAECRLSSSPLRFAAEGGSAQYRIRVGGTTAECLPSSTPDTVYSPR